MNIWNFLNGKKTNIAVVIMFTSAVLTEVVVGIWDFDPEWMPKIISTLNWVGGFLGGTGLVHKGMKTMSGK